MGKEVKEAIFLLLCEYFLQTDVSHSWDWPQDTTTDTYWLIYYWLGLVA